MKKIASRGADESYVALLRGINVGGHKVIKMDELRDAFASLGLESVKTLLASGNVVFDAPEQEIDALTERIEEKLEKKFGYRVELLLRNIGDLKRIAASDPFQGISVTPDTRLYVAFLSETPKSKLKIPYENPEKDFKIVRVSDNAVFCVCMVLANGRLSEGMNILGKEFPAQKLTTRNWNTVLKIIKTRS